MGVAWNGMIAGGRIFLMTSSSCARFSGSQVTGSWTRSMVSHAAGFRVGGSGPTALPKTQRLTFVPLGILRRISSRASVASAYFEFRSLPTRALTASPTGNLRKTSGANLNT